MKNKYDVIIIGSGIGGLTTAVLLTKIFNKKVLVLEQHFVAGGQTHEFSRTKDGKKYSWDVGVHYIGEMKKGKMSRKIFDYITNGNLKWNKMPFHFEKFVYPDFSFKQPSDPKEFQNDLIEMFPNEEDAIKQYFKDVKTAAKWMQTNLTFKIMPSWMRFFMNIFKKDDSELALSTTKEYLDKNFKDKKIKALLSSTWGDYGLPPGKSAFLMHSMVVRSYLYGGYFPIGGASSIAESMIPIIEQGGGKVMTNTSVDEIIIKNNVAVGVKVKKRKEEIEYFAKDIVSDAGAYNTYIKLIPESFNISFRDEIKKAVNDFSTNTLYLGLKESPEKLGIKGENHWIYTSYDHDDIFQKNQKSDAIYSAFVSFPSFKNPKAKTHTCEIICFSSYKDFEKWDDTKWMKRGDDYKKYKEELSKKLLDFVEESIPGLTELVHYSELSTPLTMEYFTKWEKGNFYGIPVTPQRYKYKWMSPKTPIKNLYLTGSDAVSLGVVGAMMGGVITAGVMNGIKGVMKVMKEVGK
jgi:phytoene dehydrogenase-like protein